MALLAYMIKESKSQKACYYNSTFSSLTICKKRRLREYLQQENKEGEELPIKTTLLRYRCVHCIHRFMLEMDVRPRSGSSAVDAVPQAGGLHAIVATDSVHAN